MCFEIIEDSALSGQAQDAQLKYFVQFKKKNYVINDHQKILLQMVDVSQTILYEQVFAENQFLAITNATVSHELRNPLQSISAQNLKINLCLKEILSILKTEQNATVKEVSKPLKELVNMIEQSNKIQDSSSNIMSFLVDDLLDFA